MCTTTKIITTFLLLTLSSPLVQPGTPFLKVIHVDPTQGFFPTILVHGGAGDVSNVTGKYEGTRAAVRRGYQVLEEGGTAMEAVVEAIKVLEDHPAFNAGRGSALTEPGHVEMDASVMEGSTMSAGAVASVTNLRHPIEAALAVMERTRHVMVAGDKATAWAMDQGMEYADEATWLITEDQYNNWLDWLEENSNGTAKDDNNNSNNKDDSKWSHQKGTVGAVVIDLMGNLAAGTSTGGLTGKLPGRVGDTPGIGHGTFADNFSGGVSCTGDGESFMKVGVARRVGYNMALRAMQPNQAIEEALSYMTGRVGGDGGVIAMAPSGEIGIGWNSNQMSWAYGRDGKLHYGVNPGDDFEEDI